MIYVLTEEKYDYDSAYNEPIFAHSDRNEVEQARKRCEAHRDRAIEAKKMLRKEEAQWEIDNPRPVKPTNAQKIKHGPVTVFDDYRWQHQLDIEHDLAYYKWNAERIKWANDRGLSLKEWFNLRNIGAISELGDGLMEYEIKEVADNMGDINELW